MGLGSTLGYPERWALTLYFHYGTVLESLFISRKRSRGMLFFKLKHRSGLLRYARSDEIYLPRERLLFHLLIK